MRPTSATNPPPRRLGLTALAAVMSALAFVQPAGAVDYYVNNLAGADRFNGRAAQPRGGSGPFLTIGRALAQASKGDRIVVANTGKPYRECLSVQAGHHSGLLEQPFTIESDGAVIDGTLPVPEAAWEHVRDDLYRFRPRKLSHQQLFLDNKPVTRVPVARSLLAPVPKLEPLQWCLHQGHVYFQTDPNRIPQSYALSHTALLTGITLYEVHGVRISGLVIQGFVFDGVNAHDTALDVELTQLTCRGNGRSGISVGGASRVRISRCLLGANAEAQLRIRDYCRVVLEESKLFETEQAPAIDRRGAPALAER